MKSQTVIEGGELTLSRDTPCTGEIVFYEHEFNHQNKTIAYAPTAINILMIWNQKVSFS